jgi:hypothetical protein
MQLRAGAQPRTAKTSGRSDHRSIDDFVEDPTMRILVGWALMGFGVFAYLGRVIP